MKPKRVSGKNLKNHGAGLEVSDAGTTARELHDKASIGALSDGIFGVALTLLVLDVHLLGASTKPLIVQLLGVWPRLLSFSLTFAVVAVYWIAYHRLLARIVAYDRTLLVINFLFLALIVLTPFPTSVLNEEHLSTRADARTAWVFYAGTLALVGITLAWLWQRARLRGLVDPSLGVARAEYFLVRTLIAPAAFLMSIGVAWINPKFASLTLLVIPLVHAAVGRWYRWPALSKREARA